MLKAGSVGILGYCICYLVITVFVNSGEVTKSYVAIGAPKHVLLIMTDDQGYADIGYEDPYFKTPTLDSLAMTGIRLRRLYVQSTCSPTRAALLTGRLPFEVGLGDGPLCEGERRALTIGIPTIANHLKDVGYRTVGIGKWHLGSHEVALTPTSRGFDEWFGIYGGSCEHYTYQHGVGCNEANPVNPDSFPALYGSNCYNINGFDLVDNGRPVIEYRHSNMYSTELFGAAAVAKIEAHENPETNPLFMFLSPTAPHSPLEAPDQYISRCDSIPDPPGCIIKNGRRLHCAMMAGVDDMVRNVTGALERKGMLNSTLIVYLHDNGGTVAYGGSNGIYRGSKGSFFDGGCRSNGFISTPDMRHEKEINTINSINGSTSSNSSYVDRLSLRDRDIDDLVDATDLFATIAHYAGVPLDIAEAGYGRSILNTITDNTPINRSSILLGKLGSIMGGNSTATVYKYGGMFWKLSWFPNAISVFAEYDNNPVIQYVLFDQTSDPEEMHNLYDIADALPPIMKAHLTIPAAPDDDDDDDDGILRASNNNIAVEVEVAATAPNDSPFTDTVSTATATAATATTTATASSTAATSAATAATAATTTARSVAAHQSYEHLLRGALEHGRKLLASMDSIESVMDRDGGWFISETRPTKYGCWVPEDSPYKEVDCGLAPVRMLNPGEKMQPMDYFRQAAVQ